MKLISCMFLILAMISVSTAFEFPNLTKVTVKDIDNQQFDHGFKEHTRILVEEVTNLPAPESVKIGKNPQTPFNATEPIGFAAYVGQQAKGSWQRGPYLGGLV